jgi:hypothetical protein
LREARNQLFSAALTRRQTPARRAFELGEALMAQGDVRAADRQLRGYRPGGLPLQQARSGKSRDRREEKRTPVRLPSIGCLL